MLIIISSSQIGFFPFAYKKKDYRKKYKTYGKTIKKNQKRFVFDCKSSHVPIKRWMKLNRKKKILLKNVAKNFFL